jgi:hypothetical protein
MATRTRFVGSTKLPHAKTIPSETWNQYKDIILEKYERMPLRELEASIEAEHGFYAT